MIESLNVFRRKDPTMTQEPIVPFRVPVPEPEKPLHAKAAEYANEVMALLDQKAAVEAMLAAEIAAHQTALARIHALEDVLTDTRQQLNYYHHRCVSIETKMGTVASLILEVMNTKSEPPVEPVTAEGAAERLHRRHEPDMDEIERLL